MSYQFDEADPYAFDHHTPCDIYTPPPVVFIQNNYHTEINNVTRRDNSLYELVAREYNERHIYGWNPFDWKHI